VSDTLKSIQQNLQHCLVKDGFLLNRRLQQLKKNDKTYQKKLESIQSAIKKSADAAALRKQALPDIEYPEQLPVSEKTDAIKSLINKNQVVILSGETGSGKTTQLPKICLELGLGVKGYIGHTQPRRIAARTVANRIAEELKCSIGESVGFKVRFSDHVNLQTHIKLMTDGILLAEIQSDRYLLDYEVLIIDEAHERSLNIDFILGYLKTILPKRPDLKIIITSATIDTDKFSKHFNNAPVIEVSGRTYPVQVLYHPMDESDDDMSLQKGISNAVMELNRMQPGDTLVFLPGEREIRETAEYLRKHHPPHTEILPLYARLSVKDQEKIFKSHRGRRVILATNVAETSLTVPGIRYVIDSGLARVSRYSVRSRIQRLPIEAISQAAANQRAGRCGRVSSGVCIRLYSEQDYMNRPEFTDPEILRVNLANAILQMLFLKIGDIFDFPFINPPERKNINDGMRLLQEIGAVDAKNLLTETGKVLARFPVDPRIGKMIVQAEKERSLTEVLIIASFLSVQDPRERPFEAQQKSDELHARFADKESDFLAILKLWEYYHEQARHLSQSKLRKLCKAEFISYMRMREWKDILVQIKSLIADLKFKPNDEAAKYDQIHRAILSGLLSNIGFRSDDSEFVGSRQKKFFVFPGSNLQKKPPKWLMASEIVETRKNYARNVAKINPDWLVELGSHLVTRSYFDPHWQKNRAQVGAFEKVSLYGLIIVQKNRVNYGPINPKESREIFIRHALVYGELKTPEKFLAHNQALIAEIEAEESKLRRPDILIGEEDLYQYFDAIVPENIYSGHAFHQWYKKEKTNQPDLLKLSRDKLTRKTETQSTGQTHPEYLMVDGFRFKLEYHFEPGNVEDGVTAYIPLGLLNQIQVYWFDWLVPGMIKEKVIALIKTLPKSQRRNFVPVPDHTDAYLASVKPYQQPLYTSLAERLSRTAGVAISPEDFEPERLPEHYFFYFKILDKDSKIIASGRNLVGLQVKYADSASEAFQASPVENIEKTDIKDWNFGDLPESTDIETTTGSFKAYPALQDNKDSVSLKFVATQQEANNLMVDGLLRLIKIKLDQKIKYLQNNLLHMDKMCMYYSSVSNCNELKDELLNFILKTVFLDEQKIIRSQEQFNQLIEDKQTDLMLKANEICEKNLNALKLFHESKKSLKSKSNPLFLEALSDVNQQMSQLISRHYLKQLSFEWLQQFPRYLKAIQMRLDKLVNATTVDRKNMLEIKKYWAEYEKLQKSPSADPQAVEQLRWMIEEYRVSLWAQGLKTRMPVSGKRLDVLLKQIRGN